ncbi:MAG TPA: 2-hydroxyacid dehydrogenase [Burkholderiaceae bacterium]|jgi:lactate dehydrogenase-like 2-hydroxyacid dehydrogenase|nr:2-hydroxyacid dehydrogenase [Burkholderiaceae bacterium]
MNAPEKPTLLQLISLNLPEHQALLDERFEVVMATDAAARADAVRSHGARVRAVLTNGSTGLRAQEMDAMPALTLAGALGAGYENLDRAHARERGIALCNGAGTNDDCVADHAFALLLACVRSVTALDRACRAGVWRDALPMSPDVSGRRLGIVGLGTIGAKIARRAAGFDMQIGYHNRSAREGVPHAYFDTVLALAHWADYLVVATPGGVGTRHLVNEAVLRALGPQGFLVNIARGSVVDTSALARVLSERALAGAGLDVYESEPAPPAQLLGFENVVLTPHVAGWSPQSMRASVECFLENARRHFAGEPLLTPI